MRNGTSLPRWFFNWQLTRPWYGLYCNLRHDEDHFFLCSWFRFSLPPFSAWLCLPVESHAHKDTHTHAAWIQTPLPRLGSLSSVSSARGSSPPYPYMPGSPQPWASGRKEKRGWELWRLLVWLSPKFIAFQQQSGLFFFCIQSRNGFPQCVYVRNPSLYISLLCSAESVGFETDVWCVVVFKHTCSKCQSTDVFMLRPSLRWESVRR